MKAPVTRSVLAIPLESRAELDAAISTSNERQEAA
jgi:hypothetical protein